MSDEDCSQDLFEDNPYLILNDNGKRAHSSPDKPAKKNKSVKKSILPGIMDLDQKSELIEILDQTKSLAIYDYIKQYNTCPLVKNFVDIFLKHEMLPILPPQEVVSSWLKHEVNIEVPTDLQKSLIDKFLSYFKVRYFNMNLTKANQHEKEVFQPKNNFWIPCFELLPETTHLDLHQLKSKYVREVQLASVKGTSFSQQHFILRIYDEIFEFIDNHVKIDSQSSRKKVMEYIISIAFTTAKMEYVKTRQVKNIDWETYKSKDDNIVLPKWRKENTIPPLNKTSFMSEHISELIDNKEINFNGSDTLKREEEFLHHEYKKPKQSGRRRWRKKSQVEKTKPNKNNTDSQVLSVSSNEVASTKNGNPERPRKIIRGKRTNGNSQASSGSSTVQTNYEATKQFT